MVTIHTDSEGGNLLPILDLRGSKKHEIMSQYDVKEQ